MLSTRIIRCILESIVIAPATYIFGLLALFGLLFGMTELSRGSLKFLEPFLMSTGAVIGLTGLWVAVLSQGKMILRVPLLIGVLATLPLGFNFITSPQTTNLSTSYVIGLVSLLLCVVIAALYLYAAFATRK